MKCLVYAAAIAVGLGLSIVAVPSAQAYQLNDSLKCSTNDVSGAFGCVGSYTLGGSENDVTNGGADNIATKILNNDDVFGSHDWTFGNKFDGGMTGNNTNGFSVSGLGSTSGSFNLSNLDLSKYDLAISLKSAKGFSMYYVKAGTFTNASQITWNTQGTSVNRRGAAQGLSHISYYTRLIQVPTRVQRVPEPTAMAALFGVGAVAALSRKRRRSAS